MLKKIIIKGARTHNLKNINLEIPLGKIVVVTGPSGSGKSSLVFDTIFSEAQRRYLENLAGGSQFLSQTPKAEIDEIEGLIPAIAIDAKNINRSPRSTLGTMTEIYDYLRLLFSRIGKVFCPSCGEKITDKRDERFFCPDCRIAIESLEPRLFSFNSPFGACSACTGLGIKLVVSAELVIPNQNLSLAEGAVRPWVSTLGNWNGYIKSLEQLAKFYHFSLNTPVGELNKEILKIILYGSPSNEKGIKFEGVIGNLERRWRQTDSDFLRRELEEYMLKKQCPKCHGKRLREEALSVKINNASINDLVSFPLTNLILFFKNIDKDLNVKERKIACHIIEEILRRLLALEKTGLGYLSLNRSVDTLSSGEAQRARLATQLGTRLAGILYILDEPSIGLHARDNAKLIKTIGELKKLGNSIIIIEHDQSFISAADWIIEMGPGGGDRGGRIMTRGKFATIKKAKTITGAYLSGKKSISFPSQPKSSGNEQFLIIKGACQHNLKNIDVAIPLGKLVCISGVSGSGKSTLVDDILGKALAKKFHRAGDEVGKHKEISGSQFLSKVIRVDQSPIGRTPRSNPATYSGIFTPLRQLFTETAQSFNKNLKIGHFSFNVRGGRCEGCAGDGVKKIEMYFLPDVYVTCEDCKGKRYKREILQIKYQEKNISDVLEMTIDKALKFFCDNPFVKEWVYQSAFASPKRATADTVRQLAKARLASSGRTDFQPAEGRIEQQILTKLKILSEVGLGYLKLGQNATTLSGGEAQRLKLATELARPDRAGKTLYILDEPTVGLGFEDIARLLAVLKKLVSRGNTVLIIEHNLDVLKCADWIIDLGPEGGDEGGWLVAQGTPEEVAKIKKSYTGQFFRKVLR